MKCIRILVAATVACFAAGIATHAQYASWEDCVLAQLRLDETGENALWENFMEEMTDRHEHPLNINAATRAELESLPFLTPRQVEEILFYIDYYGPLHNAGELNLITGLDYSARQLLALFVRFGDAPKADEPSLRKQLTQGRSELMARTDIPLYTRAGYEPFTQEQWEKSPSQHYWGNAMYNSIRYNWRSGTHLRWGIAAERDAGEPFFVRGIDGELLGRKGFDYYGAYLRVQDYGWLRDAVVGNYRLRFGLGLVMNGNFSLGKSMSLSGLERTVTGSPITPHGGTGESGYLHGAAATVRAGEVDITAFVSMRRQDATLSGDSVSTLLDTGLHRTSLEIDKQGNTRTQLAGAHARYSIGGLHLGATALCQHFSRLLTRGTQAYRQYYPQGSTFANLAVDYAWYSRRLSLMGETALSANGGWATLNTLRAEPFDRTYLTLLYRHYAADYWGLQANAFAEGSEVRGEDGICVGADIQSLQNWRFTANADLFRFPVQRYRVSEPSQGADVTVTAEWTPSTQWHLAARYRCKVKERNPSSEYKETYSGLVKETTQRMHIQANGTFGGGWLMQSALDGCLVSAETANSGVRVAERLSWAQETPAAVARRGNMRWAFDGELSWFYTTDYAARLYAYERGLLYAYNYRSYYGHGIRGMLMAKCTLSGTLTCTAKVGGTCFFDRDTIGSGAQLIPQNHAEDIALQVRWKF